MPDDAVARHFFNGFIRLHILYHAAKEDTYGAEITEEAEVGLGCGGVGHDRFSWARRVLRRQPGARVIYRSLPRPSATRKKRALARRQIVPPVFPAISFRRIAL